MKTSIYIILLFFALAITSCEVDPISDFEYEQSIDPKNDGEVDTEEEEETGEEKQSTEPGDSVNSGSGGTPIEEEDGNGEDRIQTDPKDSTNTGDTTPPPPPPPTDDRSQIDPEKDCPPNDRNCNGIPDDEERQRTGQGEADPNEDPDPDADEESVGGRVADTGHGEVGDPDDDEQQEDGL